MSYYPDFYIKRGDLKSTLAATLKDATGAPVDLTGHAVKLMMRSFDTGVLEINAAATIVAPALGTVKYDWQTGDTDAAGYFFAEWQVTYSTGEPQTFPTRGYHLIAVLEDLDSPVLSSGSFAAVRRLRPMIAEEGQDRFSDALLAAYLARNEDSLNLTAVDIWREKAAEYAQLVDVNVSGNSRKLSQLYDRAIKQVVFYQNAAALDVAEETGGIGSVRIHDIVR
jgi:hypothetical protein